MSKPATTGVPMGERGTLKVKIQVEIESILHFDTWPDGTVEGRFPEFLSADTVTWGSPDAVTLSMAGKELLRKLLEQHLAELHAADPVYTAETIRVWSPATRWVAEYTHPMAGVRLVSHLAVDDQYFAVAQALDDRLPSESRVHIQDDCGNKWRVY